LPTKKPVLKGKKQAFNTRPFHAETKKPAGSIHCFKLKQWLSLLSQWQAIPPREQVTLGSFVQHSNAGTLRTNTTKKPRQTHIESGEALNYT